MTRDLDAILAAIDGALADDELPDAMRWSPEPEQVPDAGTPYAEDPWHLIDRPIRWRPLSLPEATRLALQAEQSAEEYERNLARLRELFAPAAEAMSTLVDAFGKIAADAGLRFAELVDAIGKLHVAPHAPIRPPVRLRDEDPRAYALALRQARGTGPDRQVQHRPRPRRIVGQ